MKNIFLTTATISLFSLPALAVDAQFFIGGNYSGALLSYSSEAEEDMHEVVYSIPDFHNVLGVDAGLKFGTNQKGGFSFGGSIAYDYAFDTEAVVMYPYSEYVSEMSMGFSALSVMADAYINMDEKASLFIGVGYANVNQRFEAKATDVAVKYGFSSISQEEDGGALVFKMGFTVDITNGFGLNTTIRYFVPTGDSDIKGAFLWGAGLRYTF